MMRNIRSILAAGAAVGAAAIGGGAIANAATSTSTTATSSGTANGTQPAPANMPAHGTAAHEDAEKAVTGVDAAKAQAAAVKYAGSGTAGQVTTDFTGNGYEVTVTKSDGTKVEVHLDSSFAVMQGHGGPGGPGGGGNGVPPAAG
jgi:nicotinic acid phosphoribosyltransferase